MTTKKVENSPGKTPAKMGRPPGAKNKVGAELRELCQQFEEDAIATILDIMWTGDSDAVRLGAAKEILDRARGKASQAVELRMLPGPPTDLSEAELLDVVQGRGL